MCMVLPFFGIRGRQTCCNVGDNEHEDIHVGEDNDYDNCILGLRRFHAHSFLLSPIKLISGSHIDKGE